MSAAVIPALGIGDALLMMIAAEQAKMHGYQTTTFHSALCELSPWFPGHDLQPSAPSSLKDYSLIIAENDNSSFLKSLIANHRERLSIFYPTYRSTKHAPLSPLDQVFDPCLPMADNVALAAAKLLQHPFNRDNGLTPPLHLAHRAHKNRVLLHPTSRVPEKNWKARGFIKVAEKLASRGLEPLFCVSPAERLAWEFVKSSGFSLVDALSLSELAALIYTSGYVIGNDSLAGHLASNLRIPTVTIANDAKRMQLWRPGWLQGELVLPPSYLPNWRWLRENWQSTITAGKVVQAFENLYKKSVGG